MTSSSRRRGPGWSRFSTRLGIPSREDAGPFPGAWSLALCARLRASPPPPGHGWLDSGAPDRAHRLQTAETLAGLSPAGYAENSRNAWSEKPGQFTLIAMVSSACSSRRCTVIKRGMASLLEFELRSQRA
jgi:hypothetical protein